MCSEDWAILSLPTLARLATTHHLALDRFTGTRRVERRALQEVAAGAHRG
ncbi:MAG: hypothetical protein HY815_20610 [Candidatus Riflebacteria bacterium]|nr:hypothetical protein [Candidatus Riflebacteria bacterium]